MQASPQTANGTPRQAFGGSIEARRRADFVYQTVTVAAILLVLGSLWLF